MRNIYKPRKKYSFLSEKAVDVHFNGHHMKYMENIRKLLDESEIETEVKIEEMAVNTDSETIFNNCAQILNHNLFWKTLDKIEDKDPMFVELFQNPEFRKEFEEKALGFFGSGWIWITEDKEIATTKDADFIRNSIGVIDLWEHAYYVDYLNKRSEFIKSIIDHLSS